MFTRSPTVEPKAIDAAQVSKRHATVAQSGLSAPSSGEKSVIGNDLKIIGQGLKINRARTWQVDGEIEGGRPSGRIIVARAGQA